MDAIALIGVAVFAYALGGWWYRVRARRLAAREAPREEAPPSPPLEVTEAPRPRPLRVIAEAAPHACERCSHHAHASTPRGPSPRPRAPSAFVAWCRHPAYMTKPIKLGELPRPSWCPMLERESETE